MLEWYLKNDFEKKKNMLEIIYLIAETHYLVFKCIHFVPPPSPSQFISVFDDGRIRLPSNKLLL